MNAERQEWFLVGFQPDTDEGFAMRGEVEDTEAWIAEVIEDPDETPLRLFDRDQMERMYLEIRRALYPDTPFDAEVICFQGVMELRSKTKATSIRLIDYDVEGSEDDRSIVADFQGEPCAMQEWKSGEDEPAPIIRFVEPTKVYNNKAELLYHILGNRDPEELIELGKARIQDWTTEQLLDEEGYSRAGADYEIREDGSIAVF